MLLASRNQNRCLAAIGIHQPDIAVSSGGQNFAGRAGRDQIVGPLSGGKLASLR